ncbi:BZ3500_MvSof-1268-A1-R1_Chr1-3g01932 [Microbotryum saponariae]|uniref:BZ3500_MvSof-1268-A1-R1_Chr1-3g01932 protein n=1 Tax=Microbotryum saponariae TaxID=289078 RepID=A0A2X0KFG6_9BASI|nr:BZ3500_MvSof-1268-A1-R1_Chr1-3g01932 [Microbotryum saponariae]SCZ94935.1 BZ3501_MvSof-1269-A2-R1_Chr1-3g01534 [Microbotryum saponariae]
MYPSLIISSLISAPSRRAASAHPSKSRNPAVQCTRTTSTSGCSAEAFARATQLHAFQYRGLPTTMRLPRSPIDRVVEITLHCHSDKEDRDYWLTGLRVALLKSAQTYITTLGTKITTPEMPHFQRNLEVWPGGSFKLLLKGGYWCYFQLS